MMKCISVSDECNRVLLVSLVQLALLALLDLL